VANRRWLRDDFCAFPGTRDAQIHKFDRSILFICDYKQAILELVRVQTQVAVRGQLLTKRGFPRPAAAAAAKQVAKRRYE
jgi:hypothetical protein